MSERERHTPSEALPNLQTMASEAAEKLETGIIQDLDRESRNSVLDYPSPPETQETLQQDKAADKVENKPVCSEPPEIAEESKSKSAELTQAPEPEQVKTVQEPSKNKIIVKNI